MESIHSEYEDAIWKLLRAAKRFDKQIELFREADIGDEIWETINTGSDLVTALRYVEEVNSFLIHELGQLGAIKRDQLNSQDRKVDVALNALGVNVRIWVVDTTGRENSRVGCVTVAYTRESGLTVAQIRDKVGTALDRTVLTDPAGTIYAADLKFYLEDEELHGVALQDIRDEKFDWLLAGVIAKGRLNIRLREEAGLQKREPKKKKKVDNAKI